MLCDRHQSAIVATQSPGQAAFRSGYSTVDHLLVLALLIEGFAEWTQQLWVGLVDFEKAVDAVEHSALWE
eukprot:8631434-Pyramimonas_sp.AAC.1